MKERWIINKKYVKDRKIYIDRKSYQVVNITGRVLTLVEMSKYSDKINLTRHSPFKIRDSSNNE